MSIPPPILLCGTANPRPKRLALRAGPWSLCWEDGNLRYVKLGGHEVIRRIYAAVRDESWGTVPAALRYTLRDIGPDSFRIACRAEHRQGSIHFTWRGTITGERDGTIRFGFDGEAKTTFLRNRIGICVLHPIRECAGARCRARNLNGTEKFLSFPGDVAAEQPVPGLHDLAGLAHEIRPGVWAELEFAGDAFETEDQRNWIDASFKTYCTPLRIPYPVRIKAGTRVRQSVTLRLAGTPAAVAKAVKAACRPVSRRNPPVVVTLGTGAAAALPELGLGWPPDARRLASVERTRLRALGVRHFRLDVRAGRGWRGMLRTVLEECAALSVRLELALHVPARDGAFVREVAEALLASRKKLCRVLCYADSSGTQLSAALDQVERSFGEKFPSAEIGAGTRADLYQLNLNRPDLAAADAVCWSMNPQIHAFDDASLAETPEAVASQVAGMRRAYPGRRLVISPVTLKPQFNPVATRRERPAPGGLPPQVDVRQMSLFGAVWTLAMLKQLALAGAHHVTLFETVGWRGVMETAAGSPLPGKFPSHPGMVFPLYHVLTDVAELSGAAALATRSSHPLLVEAWAFRAQGQTVVLLGNFTGEARAVSLPEVTRAARVRWLTGKNAERALLFPEEFRRQAGDAIPAGRSGLGLELPPFALARITVN